MGDSRFDHEFARKTSGYDMAGEQRNGRLGKDNQPSRATRLEVLRRKRGRSQRVFSGGEIKSREEPCGYSRFIVSIEGRLYLLSHFRVIDRVCRRGPCNLTTPGMGILCETRLQFLDAARAFRPRHQQ